MRAGLVAALALGMTNAGLTQQAPPGPSTSQSPAPVDNKRAAKQKLLSDQAQRLVAMATELKVEVDKTNKNILSLSVVRKAEQIEALAHRMKDEGKK